MSLKAETYYKNFSDLIVGGLETDAELTTRLARYDFPPSLRSSIPSGRTITTTHTNGGAGRSYGVELVATRADRRGDQRLSGWASYSFGKATKEAYGLSLPFEYDRRHALSLELAGAPMPEGKVEVVRRIPPRRLDGAGSERG